MKTKILGLVAVGLLAGSVTANAVPITYTVNRTVGSATITGTITTDGTLGLISASNIVGFTLSGNKIGANFGLNGSLMGTIAGAPFGFFADTSNSILRATATDLYVDTSASSGDDFFLFYGSVEDPYGGGHETYLEYRFGVRTGDGVLAETIDLQHERFSDCPPCINFFSLPVQRLVFATAPGTPSVPEPGTLVLLGLGLAGLGLSRRRKAN